MASLSQESNPTADNEIRMRTKKKFKRNRSDQEQAGEDVNGVSSDKEVHGTSGAVLGANPASYKDMLSGANQSQDSAWQEWTENDDGDPMCFDEAISSIIILTFTRFTIALNPILSRVTRLRLFRLGALPKPYFPSD